MSLQQRVEVSISGFVAFDVFSMLAKDRCNRMRLPRGSCWFAPQTASNLQAISLSLVILALSKPKDIEPWRHGSNRLSELSIEQHFGVLRGQSSNSQLSCRSYWQASARSALKLQNQLTREKAIPGHEEALSPEELL